MSRYILRAPEVVHAAIWSTQNLSELESLVASNRAKRYKIEVLPSATLRLTDGALSFWYIRPQEALVMFDSGVVTVMPAKTFNSLYREDS